VRGLRETVHAHKRGVHVVQHVRPDFADV
jgi:hypothetical protein